MIVQVDAVLRWVGQDVHDVLNVANSRHIHDIIHISGNCFWYCISGIGKQCTDLLLHIFAFISPLLLADHRTRFYIAEVRACQGT